MQKYNKLYREAMNISSGMEERVMKLEQQRGIVFSVNLVDDLIDAVLNEIAYREANEAE